MAANFTVVAQLSRKPCWSEIRADSVLENLIFSFSYTQLKPLPVKTKKKRRLVTFCRCLRAVNKTRFRCARRWIKLSHTQNYTFSIHASKYPCASAGDLKVLRLQLTKWPFHWMHFSSLRPRAFTFLVLNFFPRALFWHCARLRTAGNIFGSINTFVLQSN